MGKERKEATLSPGYEKPWKQIFKGNIIPPLIAVLVGTIGFGTVKHYADQKQVLYERRLEIIDRFEDHAAKARQVLSLMSQLNEYILKWEKDKHLAEKSGITAERIRDLDLSMYSLRDEVNTTEHWLELQSIHFSDPQLCHETITIFREAITHGFKIGNDTLKSHPHKELDILPLEKAISGALWLILSSVRTDIKLPNDLKVPPDLIVAVQPIIAKEPHWDELVKKLIKQSK